MADYTTSDYVKEALKITSTDTDDDGFIRRLITRASRSIDQHCNRFFVGETQTRYYDAVDDVDYGEELLLDEDLLSITTLTNGDSTEITSDKYVLLPTNDTPKYAIRLKQDSSVSWTYSGDPTGAISIVGSWGYSVGTPDDIQQATVRLVVWYYKMRATPFLEVGTSDGGFQSISPSMPNDVKDILNPYRKQAIW